MHIEPIWTWGILGLVLLAVEMVSGTFYILWFGIAALCMSVALWLFPHMPVSLQLLLFAALSLSSLAIWKLNYTKAPSDLKIGQSRSDEIGKSGTVTEAINPRQIGKIVFTQGIMGSREWSAVADEDIAPGTQAVIVAIEGNMLRVRHKPN